MAGYMASMGNTTKGFDMLKADNCKQFQKNVI